MCYLTPVLRPKDLTPEEEKVFITAQEKVVPDPAVYSEWFDQAAVPVRRQAVGVARYKAMEKILGHTPSWEHFMDHETGDVMELPALKAERADDRKERVGKVRQIIADRRADAREVATFGFVRPPKKSRPFS